MPKTTSDVFADPGDIFTPGRYSPTSTRQTVRLTDGLATYSPTITIFATVDTMLALADSLVAAAWTLKTTADNAAAEVMP